MNDKKEENNSHRAKIYVLKYTHPYRNKLGQNTLAVGLSLPSMNKFTSKEENTKENQKIAAIVDGLNALSSTKDITFLIGYGTYNRVINFLIEEATKDSNTESSVNDEYFLNLINENFEVLDKEGMEDEEKWIDLRRRIIKKVQYKILEEKEEEKPETHIALVRDFFLDPAFIEKLDVLKEAYQKNYEFKIVIDKSVNLFVNRCCERIKNENKNNGEIIIKKIKFLVEQLSQDYVLREIIVMLMLKVQTFFYCGSELSGLKEAGEILDMKVFNWIHYTFNHISTNSYQQKNCYPITSQESGLIKLEKNNTKSEETLEEEMIQLKEIVQNMANEIMELKKVIFTSQNVKFENNNNNSNSSNKIVKFFN